MSMIITFVLPCGSKKYSSGSPDESLVDILEKIYRVRQSANLYLYYNGGLVNKFQKLKQLCPNISNMGNSDPIILNIEEVGYIQPDNGPNILKH